MATSDNIFSDCFYGYTSESNTSIPGIMEYANYLKSFPIWHACIKNGCSVEKANKCVVDLLATVCFEMQPIWLKDQDRMDFGKEHEKFNTENCKLIKDFWDYSHETEEAKINSLLMFKDYAILQDMVNRGKTKEGAIKSLVQMSARERATYQLKNKVAIRQYCLARRLNNGEFNFDENRFYAPSEVQYDAKVDVDANVL